MIACPACGHPSAPGAKFCSECGAPLAEAPAAREQRKTVTVLFCDLAGSTALGESTDPEALRALLARYFDRMRAIVERHGGTVEKFIGDAVMAVFGVPVVHEDDALRACRAAVEMRDALPELGIRGRIGVHTGEVVTGTAERLATGDAVNVAARLEQAAAPGEVLLGAETRRLVRDAVEVGEQRLLELKGKSQPVAAYPLEQVVADAVARRLDVPMVGRERELRVLEGAWQRALEEPSCHLFTLLGTAGIGKSRLAGELLAGIGEARVAVGRCLSYGVGVTYSPVVEIVQQLPRPADARAAAAIASLLGESDETVSADELAWAFRRTVEEAAPAVIVFDDLHWAEPTLLDLVDHLADWSRGHAVLVLCLARPELLDRRPTWGGGKLNATTVLLEPLGATETGALIERLAAGAEVSADLQQRIAAAAEGNPLYVEEMLAMLAERPDGEVRVPPTIQALLAARLDQLDLAERGVLERAAVEGQVFHRGAVEALGPDEDVGRRLMGLVRKELVRPEAPQVAGEDAFRFRHLLIRDAAYESLPKATRAELHEAFAAWLDERGRDLVEHDEITGYHLEQAHGYRVELGLVDGRSAALAMKAVERLSAAAERALGRRDLLAMTALLRRVLALGGTPEHELALVDALLEIGALEESQERAAGLAARAAAVGDRVLELRARLAGARTTLMREGRATELERLAGETIRASEDADDEAGLASGWLSVGLARHFACRFAESSDALERALEHAERAGGFVRAGSTNLWRASHIAYGPAPVEDGLRWFAEHGDLYHAAPAVQSFRGVLEAWRGNFDEGRRLILDSQARARELGQRLPAAASAMHLATVELAAGDPAAAAEVSLAGAQELEAAGENGWRSTVVALAAEALYRLGEDDRAWEQADIADDAGAADDIATQLLVRQVRAKLLTRRGELPEAERLVRQAVDLSAATDMLAHRADVHVDLAGILETAGRTDEAAAELETAARLYEQKGQLEGLSRVRRLLAAAT